MKNQTTTESEKDQAAKLRELCETLRFDYHNPKAAIARVALATVNGNLAEDVSFLASCELLTFGPANDWNGHRSAATRAMREWEAKIQTPALAIARRLKARREAELSAHDQETADGLERMEDAAHGF